MSCKVHVLIPSTTSTGALCQEQSITFFTLPKMATGILPALGRTECPFSPFLSTKSSSKPSYSHYPTFLIVTFTIFICTKFLYLQALFVLILYPNFPTFSSSLIHSIQHILLSFYYMPVTIPHVRDL